MQEALSDAARPLPPLRPLPTGAWAPLPRLTHPASMRPHSPAGLPLEDALRRSIESREASSASAAPTSLRFARTALGGTFDRLHAGHRLMLAAAALVTSGSVFVGVTGDKLLANKRHRELLQGYAEREQAAASFLQRVRPGLQVETGPLLDPAEPTRAALDHQMEALVVSRETVPGGLQINEQRRCGEGLTQTGWATQAVERTSPPLLLLSCWYLQWLWIPAARAGDCQPGGVRAAG